MTTFTVKDQARQSAAAIRAEVPMAELRSVFDRAFGAVMAAVGKQGVSITGPPFGFYPRMPTETVEVVVGFPVSGPVTPDGEVVPFELPGGPAISGVHVGPYERLEQCYSDLEAWAPRVGERAAM